MIYFLKEKKVLYKRYPKLQIFLKNINLSNAYYYCYIKKVKHFVKEIFINLQLHKIDINIDRK